MTPAAAAAAIDSARGELDRRDTRRARAAASATARRSVSAEADNVIHAAALTAVGAS